MVFRYNPLNSRHMILAKLALICLTQLLYYKLEKFFLKVYYMSCGIPKAELSSQCMKVKLLITQSCPSLCNLRDCKPARLLSPWNSQGKNTRVAIPSPGNLHDPGIKLGSLALQADSLLSDPSGKPELPVYRRHSYICNSVVLNTIYRR